MRIFQVLFLSLIRLYSQIHIEKRIKRSWVDEPVCISAQLAAGQQAALMRVFFFL